MFEKKIVILQPFLDTGNLNTHYEQTQSVLWTTI